MTTFRIKNQTGMSDSEAFSYVYAVINQGRISKTRGHDHYCFYTVFEKCRVASGLSSAGVFWFVVSDVEDGEDAQSQES